MFLKLASGMLGCGSSDIQFDNNGGGGGGSGTISCDDTGDDVATGDLLAEINGNVCKTPAPWLNGDSLVLSCTTTETDGDLARNTTDSATDNTTVTCGTEEVLYYCVDGVVYKEVTDGNTALYESTTINCTVDGDGVGEITEEELVIS